jgi:hypothetical protein
MTLHWRSLAGAALCTFGLCATASAQWFDNFDSYTAGTVINGQGGWQQWDNVPNTTSVVSTAHALSGANSAGIYSTAPGTATTSDLVHRFSGYTSGKWVLKGDVYIPGPTSPAPLTETVYFLILNTYNDFGPYNWSVELDLRAASGIWLLYPGSGAAVSGTLLYDQWVECRAEIDLNLDQVEIFYNGVSCAPPFSWTGGWIGGGGGVLDIACLDLYHDPGSNPNSGAFWDNVGLFPTCPALTSFCTSGTTTNGCTATISGVGTPSATAGSGFNITVNNVEGQKQGILFYGISNAGFTPTPWGAGGTSYLCVKAPTQRTGVQNSGGTIGQCNGTLSLDWNAYIAANPTALGSPFSAGDQVFAQGWFRDPPAVKTTSLSNGLSFVLCP